MVVDDFCVLTFIGGGGTVSSQGHSVEVGLGTSIVVPAGTGPVRVAGDLIVIATTPGPELA
jgi:mannose-6-phosphate isomerase class I